MALERPYVGEMLDWLTVFNIIHESKAMTTNDQLQPTTTVQHSPFLTKFPDELRNRVYHLVLVFDDDIIINTAILRGQRSILQICRQTRDEASQIYYNKNAFRIPARQPKQWQTIKPAMFFKTTGYQNASLITKLTITFRLTGRLLRLMNVAIEDRNMGGEKEKNRSHQKLVQNVIDDACDTGTRLVTAGVRLECIVVEKPTLGLSGVEEGYELETLCANRFEEELFKVSIV